MQSQAYCVYNQRSESFLCLGVFPAITRFARLKGLIGRLRLRLDQGLWTIPSKGVHTIGVLFPIDLVYLDGEQKVVDIIEHFPVFRIAPLRKQAVSVLQLPIHTIYSSNTQIGDQLLICEVEEMDKQLNQESKAQTPVAQSIIQTYAEMS